MRMALPSLRLIKKGMNRSSNTRIVRDQLRSSKFIQSIKELIESKLRIPVVQLEIHGDLAGATVSSGAFRGIVINLNGDNGNPLARRMTMAHELGHLLWDPDQRLKKLVVDRYDLINQDAVSAAVPLDFVERRANAFAIELLAPRSAILREFDKAGHGAKGLSHLISTFGVSRTAVANHLLNASFNRIDVTEERISQPPSDEWEARESLAVPLFNPQTVPVSRRGRFAYCVFKAYRANLISADTAASLYQCRPDELDRALKSTENFVIPERYLVVGLHTRSTKLSTTRFSPALSNAMVSLLPSTSTTLPLPNFW